jgi:predicted CXXCH cytochrome family protein
MRAELGYITRRERGAPARRTVEADAPVLHLGRGPGNEVGLPDLRVALIAAELSPDAGGMRLRATAPGDVRVNGKSTTNALVVSGDEIRIGPYKLTLDTPGAGYDAAIAIELVDPPGDDLARLRKTSRIGLERTRLGKRLPSWMLFLLLVVFGLAIPVGSFLGWGPQRADHAVPKPGWTRVADLSWTVGEISDAHKHFAADCGACHQRAFASVPDSACAACHTGLPGHATGDAVRKAGLDNAGCGDCHTEHRGAQASILRDDRLCTDCHTGGDGRMAGSHLRAVTGFPEGHPPFRVTVLKDTTGPVLERVDLSGPTPPKNLATLKFPHDAHLKTGGVLSPKGLVKLDCASCHAPDAGRQGFLPTRFETDCGWCHTLKFDPKAPERTVPHGDPEAVHAYLRDAYARIALEGGDAEIAAGLPRLRVGQPVTEAERLELRAWVQQRVDAAVDLVFDPRRGCGSCHIATRKGATVSIEPVIVLDSHLPKTRFDHGQHFTMGCGECHKAEQSTSSSDVLIPNLDTCVACHGAANATLKVPSDCTSCHGFHIHGTAPMTKIRQER